VKPTYYYYKIGWHLLLEKMLLGFVQWRNYTASPREVAGFKSNTEIQFAARIGIFRKGIISLEVGAKANMLSLFA